MRVLRTTMTWIFISCVCVHSLSLVRHSLSSHDQHSTHLFHRVAVCPVRVTHVSRMLRHDVYCLCIRENTFDEYSDGNTAHATVSHCGTTFLVLPVPCTHASSAAAVAATALPHCRSARIFVVINLIVIMNDDVKCERQRVYTT